MRGPRARSLGLSEPTVTVLLLTKLAPRALSLASPARHLRAEASGDTLLVDGQVSPSPLQLPDAAWRVEAAGHPARRFQGALELRAAGGRLLLTGHLGLEGYVAQVVASETAPGTPPAALRAQAVVTRSYAQAAHQRHPGGALCDLAHCQLLRGGGIPAPHLAAAEAAAGATAGQVLRRPGGAIAEATFHARCGGQTADPQLAFGSGRSGAGAVADPGCQGERWSVALGRGALAGALRAALREAGDPAAEGFPAALGAADLALRRDPGGWVVQVSGRHSAWRLSGDAAARAMDAAAGRGRVRSSRLTLSDEGGSVRVRGSGHGHGVGLCQAGAARRAAAGQGHEPILAAFFPGAVLEAASVSVGPAPRVETALGPRRSMTGR